MSEKIGLLKNFAEYIFNSLDRTLEGITEKELDWQPLEESNSLRWTLNHLSRLSNLSIPRVIKGDPDYSPEGWPEDYRDQAHSLEKFVGDIAKGRESVIEFLGELSDSMLDDDIPLWGGTRKRQFGLFVYLSELIHHRGQIAYLKGTIKRHREKNEAFLM
jgi:uncharacterized damage-inducible protein DinB